ncbi:hypothetical protein GF359_06115 [candidate division WOR-3 bacterium]|uniref:Fibronectin type-III domain-containing protein n=1 Tax=candidate division WOR-3 bacterium TaxID=2052148 RepID=A0A9D5KAS4_UNCW3|nr:hypothetical protein [candidate division WOR-3 bacterium]MBD3364774.1 hypothetical protein [candidate division WOR-3 bacterium]
MNKKVIILAFALLLSVSLSTLSCDGKPPTVSIINPEDGSFVEDEVRIEVEAEDEGEIDQVYFYINNTFMLADANSPYEYVWDASGLNRGTKHLIKATAFDKAGNEASDVINVTIGVEDDKPPIVQITSPEDGSSVSDEKHICVDAEDNVRVENVLFLIDEVEVFDDAEPPYEYVWDLAGLEHGSDHLIEVFAYDPAGNEGRDAINLVVDTMHPIVSIMEPDDGARVWGMVTIRVDAVDNDEVVYVDFYIDFDPDDPQEEPDTSVGNEPYEYIWGTYELPPESSHEISVTAYDEAGNEAWDVITVTVGE